MFTKPCRRVGLAALACVVLALPVGCAQQRDPINRVQANALSKHFFVGPSLSDPSDDPEFYMGNRIVDEPYGVGQGFWMFQSIGSVARIKWEIQEDKLVARLTYERIQDSDHHGSRATNSGQVVAMFNITSHFDIIHDYNLQTGEQLNVVVENTTDRPWYEREYFRVDWSTNLVTDAYDFDMFAQGASAGVKYDPLSYFVEDPSDPDAPVFSDPDGYFDVTTKIFATPQTISTPYGAYPACMLFAAEASGGTSPVDTCNPAEVKVRLSFKKVVDDDYEPEDWDGHKMDAFGWFGVDRFGYERNYGVVDQKWHRFAAKFNIWQKSHIDGTQCAVDAWRDAAGNVQKYAVDASGQTAVDPTSGLPVADPNGQPFTRSAPGQDVHRDLDHDGTEDECQFVDAQGQVVTPGSRCDEFTSKCDLPLYLRQTKTTPLYYGPTAPPDLFASTAHALSSWNLAVKRAVQLGKVVEAKRAHVDIGTQQTTEADLLADGGKTVPDVFVLCHNPVIQGDAAACGAAGLKVRLGDLRYSVVDVIQSPQDPSAWGIMSDFNDPVTGEKVQASINEWAYVLDIASQTTEDILRWINGEITDAQIAGGQYMKEWLAATKLGASQYAPSVLSSREIQSRLGSIDRSSARLNGLPAGPKMAPVIASKVAAQNLATALGPSLDADFEATRQKLLGSQWEAKLVTPDTLQMAGFNPQQPFAGDPTTLSRASPIRALDPSFRRWASRARTTALVNKNMCVLDQQPEPDGLVGLAREAARLFPLPPTTDPSYPARKFRRDRALHQWIREQFHASVIAHEMGHSMGLRHNFAGSFDALNYHTEYWQLRTRNGQEHYCSPTAGGALDALTPHTDGTDCVGPRWVDPVTDQEQNGLIWKWASTSVMDYPGDQTQDMNDIGNYDKAAMRFGYADIVDVENKLTVATSSGSASGSGMDYIQALDGFGGIWGNSIGGNHYSQYADKYALLGTCADRPGWTGDPGDPLEKQCPGPDLDYFAVRDMLPVDQFSSAITQARPDLVASFAVDPKGRVRHPYMFGGDEFADVGNIPVFRFDAGADSYEQMQFLVSTYENRYIFDDFRRNRVTFNTSSAVDRLEDRYWDKIQAITKSLALGVELLTQPGNDPTKDPASLMPVALGSADGLAMFVRAITRPAPGPYVVVPASPADGVPNTWGRAWQLGDPGSPGGPPTTNVTVALGDGEGRYLHNDYDYTKGYWWSQYQTQVGSSYEKSLAVHYLLEAYNNFVSNAKDDYVDGRYKNLNYATIYPNQVRRLLANVAVAQSPTQVVSQWTAAQIFTIAPYVTPPAASTASPVPVQYLPWDRYDPTDAATTALAYPAGAVLLDPLLGWEQQYRALLLEFRFGRTTQTMDFVDQIRIFSPGDAASLAIAAGQQVRYRDPATGIEYAARNYGTESVNPAVGQPVAKTIGARMLGYANSLAQAAFQVTATDLVTGELTYATDAQGNPVPSAAPQAQDAATMLRDFTANVDVVRQLTYFFGYGPLSSVSGASSGP